MILQGPLALGRTGVHRLELAAATDGVAVEVPLGLAGGGPGDDHVGVAGPLAAGARDGLGLAGVDEADAGGGAELPERGLHLGLDAVGGVLGVQPPAHRGARVVLDLVARCDPAPRAAVALRGVGRVDREATTLARVARGLAGGLHDDPLLDLLVVPGRLGLEVEPALAVGLVLVHLLPARGQLLLEDDDPLLDLLALDLAVHVGRRAVDGGGGRPDDLLELGRHPPGGEGIAWYWSDWSDGRRPGPWGRSPSRPPGPGR